MLRGLQGVRPWRDAPSLTGLSNNTDFRHTHIPRSGRVESSLLSLNGTLAQNPLSTLFPGFSPL